MVPSAGLPRTTTVDEHTVTPSSESPTLQNGFYERRTQTVNQWQVQQSAFNRPFPVLSARSTSTYDRPMPGGIGAPPPFEFNGTLLSSCDDHFIPDPYGNITDEYGHCTVGSSDVELSKTIRTFTPDPSTWLISNLENIKVSNTRRTKATREHHFTYTDGLLATVTRAPNGTNDQWHQSTFQRDDLGNVRQIIESTRSAPSRTTTVTYDDDGIFPSTVTNPAGQMTRLSFDHDWGAPDGIVDPNGIAVQFSHDGFGRLIDRVGPDGVTVSTYSAIPLPNTYTPTGQRTGNCARQGGQGWPRPFGGRSG